MRSFWGAACVALCASASSAVAADLTPVSIADRFYISFHGGSVFDSVSDDTATKPSSTTYITQGVSKPGFDVGAAVGKDVNNVLRIEGEINYANATIDHVNAISPGPGTLAATGSGSSLVAMLNAYLRGHFGAVTPYVGAGIGLASFTANNIKSGSAVLNGSDGGWAYQLMAGVDFDLTANTSLGGRYRYVKINDLTLPDGGYTHAFSTTSQSVEVVLTHHFQ